MNKEVSSLINTQINKELYSAYIYLDISNFYYDKGLDGFAHWFGIQVAEEKDHALRLLNYMRDNGEHVELMPVEKPEYKLKELRDGLETTAKHERLVTSLINGIYAAAQKANDYRAMQFLDWFIREQREEESNADDLLKKFDLLSGNAGALYIMNKELKKRKYTAPEAEED